MLSNMPKHIRGARAFGRRLRLPERALGPALRPKAANARAPLICFGMFEKIGPIIFLARRSAAYKDRAN